MAVTRNADDPSCLSKGAEVLFTGYMVPLVLKLSFTIAHGDLREIAPHFVMGYVVYPLWRVW